MTLPLLTSLAVNSHDIKSRSVHTQRENARVTQMLVEDEEHRRC